METTIRRAGRPSIQLNPDDAPNQLRAIRLQRNLMIQEVADMIGVGSSSVSEYETTGRGLGRTKLLLLAKTLQVSYGDLVNPGQKYAENILHNACNTSANAV